MPLGDRKLTMEELGRIDPGSYSRIRRPQVCIVLDDVRSRHNVGSIFRTADAFGLERLILCGFTPLPPHREIEKTALGATHSVPWEHAVRTTDAIAGLKATGYTVLAVEQTLRARPLGSLPCAPGTPLALVFGNELNGVSDQVIASSDGCLIVPQYGSKHSLNVSVCAGVVLWEFLRGQPV